MYSNTVRGAQVYTVQQHRTGRSRLYCAVTPYRAFQNILCSNTYRPRIYLAVTPYRPVKYVPDEEGRMWGQNYANELGS